MITLEAVLDAVREIANMGGPDALELAVADWLKAQQKEWYICFGDDDLRAVALEKTGLVEPREGGGT